MFQPWIDLLRLLGYTAPGRLRWREDAVPKPTSENHCVTLRQLRPNKPKAKWPRFMAPR